MMHMSNNKIELVFLFLLLSYYYFILKHVY